MECLKITSLTAASSSVTPLTTRSSPCEQMSQGARMALSSLREDISAKSWGKLFET